MGFTGTFPRGTATYLVVRPQHGAAEWRLEAPPLRRLGARVRMRLQVMDSLAGDQLDVLVHVGLRTSQSR